MKTILVIEDDQNIRDSISDLLETSNFNVLAAANGKEGLALALAHDPDLILCDVMMPVMDGYEVIAAVRKERKLAETPFIFLSAKAQKADMRKGMDLGADDYLTKPFKAQELFDAVETRIWRKEAGTKELQDTRQELEKLNQQLVAISEADIPVAMIISDLRGTIVHFSKGAERLLGYTAAEVVNRKPITMLHLPEEIDARTNALSAELGRSINLSNGFLTEIPNAQSYESREWTYIRKDRSRLPVQLVVSTIQDNQAQITGYLGVAIDISERKAAEAALQYAKEQAEMANRLKSQFLANMSHEIRTPMNSILGFSDILLNLVSDPQAKKYLTTIATSGRTLMALINDLLDLAKIEAGKMMLRPEPLKIRLVLEEVGQMFAEELRKKNVELRVSAGDNVPDVLLLDDIRLRQMLINLMGNAVKFTHQGFVRLAVEADRVNTDPGCLNVKIHIQDTGIGISRESQSTIFDSFQQVHDTTTSQYGGTGLGLTITLRLAEMMGGTIVLESEPGKGSVFSILLPSVKILELPKGEEQPASSAVQEIRFKPATILAVDDVTANLDLILGYLGPHPIRVITAQDGKEAILKAEAIIPDVILMDLRMPEMDGWEACRRIRTIAGLDKVPVVACTASLIGNEPVEETFDAVLLKPLNRTQIYDLLCRFLPFEIVSDKRAEATTTDDETAEEKQRLRPLYATLNEKYSHTIRAQREGMDLSEMEKMLREMIAFATANNMVNLLRRLEILAASVERFDLDQITRDLENTESLLNNGI